ncbi:MAG: alanine racemase [Paracoccus sp. (in: a-proteobacteria)]|uniref:alanine racemase n=1 Tax=Paracoccus sp. TaxID=267 RepID=UPI0026E0252D|nr:alanine racemase [Paracoccus sp. (in: a-proteobacteria)]MDO5622848.1 alanine racemase [Paracoccus sp. (in: a-proteobacteria)]
MTPAQIGPALEAAEVFRPALVLDLSVLRANIAALRAGLPAGYALRLADKSLAAPELLDAAMTGLGTRAVMSFHLGLTAQVLDRFPDADVLMGKPALTGDAAAFLRDHPRADRVTWLIDSAARAADYARLATDLGRDLPVAYEVDIGLGRGGFGTPAELSAARLPGLTPRGLMGYEVHTAGLPRWLGGGAPAQARAMRLLAGFRAVLPHGIINTGGSQTAMTLPPNGPGNEITIGSALVKPCGFDQPCNMALRPALWIAAPVLKDVRHSLPGHPRLSALLRRLGIIRPRLAFTHSGKWLARPVWPEGLGHAPFHGQSSNQQGFAHRGTAPDWIILRPTQSEAVIQDFPALHLMENGQITGTWHPFPRA